MENEYSFKRLLEIMKTLRSENGCPWDIEQTNESIKNDTLEEAYELVEAINKKDDPNLVEELGDLLLHVVFHSQIGSDENRFTIEDVLKSIIEKMIRRHPHVFHDGHVKDSKDVLIQWEDIKKEEKSHITHSDVLRSVPDAMPALMKAYKVQKKAAKCGFDFETQAQLFEKLEEEVHEVKEAVELGDINHLEEEIGDLLFQTVNISRFFKINAENALTNAVEKFINRFEGIEQLAISEGLQLDELSLTQMDELWDQIKKRK